MNRAKTNDVQTPSVAQIVKDPSLAYGLQKTQAIVVIRNLVKELKAARTDAAIWAELARDAHAANVKNK